MRHFGVRRLYKTSLALLGGLVLATQYQNCTPVGDANGVGEYKINSNPTVNCALAVAPRINGTPPSGTLTGALGLGTGSGNSLPARFNIPLIKGYATQNIDDNCSIGAPLDSGINTGCQIDTAMDGSMSLRVQIQPRNINGNQAECVSGSAVVTLRVRDDACNQVQSAPVTFNLNITDACPQQVKVRKDNSSAELAPARADEFGSKVAISGNWAVVTATRDDQKANEAGAAFVYNWNGTSWVYKQKLMPAEAGANSEVDTVAISGNLIVLGAPYHGNWGAVWAFRLNGGNWVQSGGQIEPSLKNSAVLTENFGYEVAIAGSTVLVGAPGYYHNDPMNFARAGAVFVFNDTGSALNEVQVLSASDKAPQALFGASVAATTTTLVVGAPGSGKAYAYAAGTYAETALASGLPANSLFGVAVSATASRIVVGAPGALNGGNGVGAIVSFASPNWAFKQRVFGSASGALYGTSVAASGNDVLVGAPSTTINNATRGGAAHLLRLDGAGDYKPYFIYRPRVGDQGFDDYYGESVALGNGFTLAGSRADDLSDSDMGSAFFIKVP